MSVCWSAESARIAESHTCACLRGRGGGGGDEAGANADEPKQRRKPHPTQLRDRLGTFARVRAVLPFELRDAVLRELAGEVLPAKLDVAVRLLNAKEARLLLHQGDVELSATNINDQHDSLLLLLVVVFLLVVLVLVAGVIVLLLLVRLVEAVSEGHSARLNQSLEHVEPRLPARLQKDVAIGPTKARRHRHDSGPKRSADEFLGEQPQVLEQNRQQRLRRALPACASTLRRSARPQVQLQLPGLFVIAGFEGCSFELLPNRGVLEALPHLFVARWAPTA